MIGENQRNENVPDDIQNLSQEDYAARLRNNELPPVEKKPTQSLSEKQQDEVKTLAEEQVLTEGEKKPEEGKETFVAKTETIIRKEKAENKDGNIEFRNFYNRKKEIEARLSEEAVPEDEKESLKSEKSEISAKLIEEGSKILGRDLNKEMKDEQERQWKIGLASSGYKDEKGYEAHYRENYYNEIINKSALSENQKKSLFEEGGLVISSWPSSIELTKEDIVVALNAGIDVNQIKRNGFFSKKIVAGEMVLGKNLEEFNQFILQKKQEVDSEIHFRMEKRKEEIIEKSVSEPVANSKIEEVASEIAKLEPQKKEEQFQPTKKSEKQEFDVKTKLELLSDVQNNWEKAKKINEALVKNKKIKLEDGEALNPRVLADADTLEGMKRFLSQEIIKTAGDLDGQDLMELAGKETGVSPDEKNEEKRRELEKWLTNKVIEIFNGQVKEIEAQTGKRVKIQKKASPETLAEENELVEKIKAVEERLTSQQKKKIDELWDKKDFNKIAKIISGLKVSEEPPELIEQKEQVRRVQPERPGQSADQNEKEETKNETETNNLGSKKRQRKMERNKEKAEESEKEAKRKKHKKMSF